MATFKDAIAARGIDERHQIELLKRRARYVRQCDRPKVWPSSKGIPPIWAIHASSNRGLSEQELRNDLNRIQAKTATSEYVIAWCRLNHLKVAA